MANDTAGTSIRNASATVTVPVWATVMPETVAEVADAVRRSNGRLSVSGARLSPDAQFALDGALHLDLSRLDKVLRFEPLEAAVRVQAGIRWAELLRFIQPHGFSPYTMPRFADFSVGGSIAVNATGDGVNVGPVGAGVRGLRVVLADGEVVWAAPDERPELFTALIGGLGGIAVIVEAELRLARNVRLRRKSLTMPVDQYVDHFKARIASDPGAVFHRAEFALPSLRRLHLTTWVETGERCTDDQPLHVPGIEEPLARVFDRPRAPGWLGRLRDDLITVPLQRARKVVRWRNFEASRPVTSLDPRHFEQPQLELQQFVVAIGRFNAFVDALGEIVARYRVPLAMLSVGHYGVCPSSLLGLARDDAFAVTLAVRARQADALASDYAAWSRELIDAAIAVGGAFHPGHAMYATPAQFRSALPGTDALLAVRAAVDPAGRLGNGAWTAWLEPEERRSLSGERNPSEFHALLADPASRDMAFRLFDACGPAGHGPRLFGLLQRMARRNNRDELIYRNLRNTLAKWRASPLAFLTMRPTGWQRDLGRRLADTVVDRFRAGRPAAAQDPVRGLIEVGSGGRIAAELRRRIRLEGPVLCLEADGRESQRGGSARLAAFMPARVEPRTAPGDGPGGETDGGPDGWAAAAPPASVDLVILGTGLAGLDGAASGRALAALAAALRPGGLLLLLEHDADTGQAGLEAAMAVTLAALCAGATWEASQTHPRAFQSADEWVERLAGLGLVECAARERIRRTPYGDTLLALRKPSV